jgi:hypothetical protein
MLAGHAKNSLPVSIGDAVTQDKPRDSKIVKRASAKTHRIEKECGNGETEQSFGMTGEGSRTLSL